MEALDPESEQIREVFAQYGRAMYEAQCVERELVILSPRLYGMNNRTTTRAEVEGLFDDFFGKTLGTVVRRLEASVGLPLGLEGRIKRALSIRNFLAHNFFWERAGRLVSHEGREKILAELRELSAFLGELDAEMTALSRDWRRANGVTDKRVGHELQELIARSEEPVK